MGKKYPKFKLEIYSENISNTYKSTINTIIQHETKPLVKLSQLFKAGNQKIGTICAPEKLCV